MGDSTLGAYRFVSHFLRVFFDKQPVKCKLHPSRSLFWRCAPTVLFKIKNVRILSPYYFGQVIQSSSNAIFEFKTKTCRVCEHLNKQKNRLRILKSWILIHYVYVVPFLQRNKLGGCLIIPIAHTLDQWTIFVHCSWVYTYQSQWLMW